MIGKTTKYGSLSLVSILLMLVILLLVNLFANRPGFHRQFDLTEDKLYTIPEASLDVVRELLSWDDGRRSSEWLLCNLALVIAGVVILASAVFALLHMTDHVILAVLVPGFVVGLFFVGLYVLGGRRVRERHRLASVIRKLKTAV